MNSLTSCLTAGPRCESHETGTDTRPRYTVLFRRGPARRFPVARRGRGECVKGYPDVQRSREQIRLLDGRVMEERAVALPEVNAHGTLTRYLDPSFLNSTAFDQFPPELRAAIQP